MPVENDDPLEARRRQRAAKARQRLVLVIVAGGFLFATLATLAIVWAVTKRKGEVAPYATGGGQAGSPVVTGNPVAAREGESWSQRDLWEFLKGRGIQCEMQPGRASSVYLMYPRKDPLLAIATWEDSPATPEGFAEVIRHSNADAAIGHAGRYPTNAFSWGRFSFRGHQEFLTRIQAALR